MLTSLFSKASISNDNFDNFVIKNSNYSVEDCKNTIKEKEEQISSIQSEIEAENQRISELQSALNKIEVLSGSK